MDEALRRRHAWSNRLQTALLILALCAINAFAGTLLFGEYGLWIALAVSLLALLFEPAAGMPLTLRLYQAQPISARDAPELTRLTAELARRATLAEAPELYYVPSPLINAFTLGNRRQSAIALSGGLLRELAPREIAGILGHEIAHIAHDDLRVMGLADLVSRLTTLYALAGQGMLLLMLPAWVAGYIEIGWLTLLLLAVSPWLTLFIQLGLSRIREFDADQKAAWLTGDPLGLASALAKVELTGRSWRALLLPGWGNPQPSWLRSHPPTAERIRRLTNMQAAPPICQDREIVWPAGENFPTPPRRRRGDG